MLNVNLAQFNADMNQVNLAADRLRQAILAVKASLGPPPVWVGQPADYWTQEFMTWAQSALQVLDGLPDEQHVLQQQVSQQVAPAPTF
jgi:hypothetical protein